MAYSVGFIVFLFGLIVGSFLNVVILRYGTGKSLNGRSGCFTCGGQLRWWELVPVLSYVLLRGTCARCGAHISWQYPVVEFITGLLFVGVWLMEKPVIPTLILFGVVSVCVVLAVYDFKHTILPDEFSYALMGLSVFYAFWHAAVLLDLVWAVVAGIVVAAPIFALWALSRGRAMGFGDVKLAVSIGILLGGYLGLSALWYAFVIGAVYGLGLMACGKANAKSEVAFGPFLIAGTLLVLFTEVGFFELTAAIL